MTITNLIQKPLLHFVRDSLEVSDVLKQQDGRNQKTFLRELIFNYLRISSFYFLNKLKELFPPDESCEIWKFSGNVRNFVKSKDLSYFSSEKTQKLLTLSPDLYLKLFQIREILQSIRRIFQIEFSELIPATEADSFLVQINQSKELCGQLYELRFSLYEEVKNLDEFENAITKLEHLFEEFHQSLKFLEILFKAREDQLKLVFSVRKKTTLFFQEFLKLFWLDHMISEFLNNLLDFSTNLEQVSNKITRELYWLQIETDSNQFCQAFSKLLDSLSSEENKQNDYEET